MGIRHMVPPRPSTPRLIDGTGWEARIASENRYSGTSLAFPKRIAPLESRSVREPLREPLRFGAEAFGDKPDVLRRRGPIPDARCDKYLTRCDRLNDVRDVPEPLQQAGQETGSVDRIALGREEGPE